MPILTPIKKDLTLEQADAIADGCLRVAHENDILPLTVAVLDAGGHLVVLKREDGSGIVRVQVATGKAYGALGMGASSRVFGERLASKQVFSTAVTVASGGNFISVPGGVLILDEDGSAIGAVGISGDSSERDEFAAIGGVKAAGFASEPAEPLSDWND